MKLLVAFTLGLAFALVARAQEIATFPILKTTDGIEYKGVTVAKVLPDSIKIIHDDGAASIPLANLPGDLQKRFNFDPSRAAAFTKSVNELLAIDKANVQKAAADADAKRRYDAALAERKAAAKSLSGGDPKREAQLMEVAASLDESAIREAEFEAQRKKDEPRGIIRIVGDVAQKLDDGLLVFWVDAGNQVIHLKGYRDESEVVDGDRIASRAKLVGVYKYTSEGGAKRTVRSFQEVPDDK